MADWAIDDGHQWVADNVEIPDELLGAGEGPEEEAPGQALRPGEA
jgi:hypothetical protein